MAINIYPESPIISLCSSPRLSFSHDLDHDNPNAITTTVRSDHSLLSRQQNPPDFAFPDFAFCAPPSSASGASSADELFSGGVIIPNHQLVLPKNPQNSNSITNPIPKPSIPPNHTQKEEGIDEEQVEEQKRETTKTLKKEEASLVLREEKPGSGQIQSSSNTNSKPSSSSSSSSSFWGFKRSSSCNSDGTSNYYYHKKGSIWSSLPLLARSNSTGSAPNNIPTKQSTNRAGTSGCSTKHLTKSHSVSNSPLYSNSKPPARKGGPPGSSSMSVSGGGGVSSSPVLNVPPPYIIKGTSDLLGLGSLFRNGKDKKNKKR